MQLTIAIPTYNRNEVLRESLAHLLPQLHKNCQLLILDDHSEVPVNDTLQPLLQEYPDVQLRIIRNKYNVGLGANILRCFELCETEWMWLSGDDDLATSDAVATVLRHIEEHSDCCFINFVGPTFQRTQKQIADGFDDFVTKLDSWRNLLFMSVGVYHCPTLAPQLRFAYHYSYSYGPHIALLLPTLQRGARSVLSDSCIVQRQSPGGWSPVVTLLGKMSLLELPMKDSTRKMFARKLRAKPSLEAIVTMLMHAAQKEENSKHALFLYDQICARCFYFDGSLILRIKMAVYRLMLRFHRLSFSALEYAYPALSRMLGKSHVRFHEMRPADTYTRL